MYVSASFSRLGSFFSFCGLRKVEHLTEKHANRFSGVLMACVSLWILGFSSVYADEDEHGAECVAAVVKKEIQANCARIEGDVYVQTKGKTRYTAGTRHHGSLYLPGTPELRTSRMGRHHWGAPGIVESVVVGNGSVNPKNYPVKILSWSELETLVTRTDPEPFPSTLALLPHQGARTVHLKNSGQSAGDFGTVKNLKLTGKAGLVAIPAGQYHTFRALGRKNGFILGTAGSTEVQDYHFHNLVIAPNAKLKIISPVRIIVGCDLSLHGAVGNAQHPEHLEIHIPQGKLNLMPCACLYGLVYVPEGRVHMHPHTILKGRVYAQTLKMQTHSKLICGLVDTSGELPIAESLSIDVLEDEAADIELSGNSPGNLALTYTVTSQPTNGSLTGTAPNLVYTPNANYSGQDSFTYKVSDANGESESATVTIRVNAVNDTPVAENISKSLDEDTPLSVTLLAFDQEGDVLTYEIVTQPTKGVLSGEIPNLIYTPSVNVNGQDSFTYRVTDGINVSNISTVTLNILAVNDAPTAAGISQSLLEDSSAAITLQASDVEGDTLTYNITKQPQFGIAVLENGVITYTPNANYNGQDKIEYTAQDDDSTSNIAEVSLTITPENDAPTAAAVLTLSVGEDDNLNLALSGTDIDGDALTYQVTIQPQHGTLTGTAPDLVYTPDENYEGLDSFSYKVNDGVADSLESLASITVTPANDPPVAQGLTLSAIEDIPLPVTLAGTDIDGDSLTYTVVGQPSSGSLTGTVPNLVYTPAPNVNGQVTFTFKVNDGTEDSDTATVTINISPVNDAPVAQNVGLSLDEDVAAAVTLTASDIDGDNFTFTIVAQPLHGVLTGTAPNFTYTPTGDYHGPDSFTFKVNDSALDSNVATVSLTVSSINDQPIVQNLNLQTNEDDALTVLLSGTDADGDSLIYTILTQPTNGTLTGTAPNLTYTPSADYHGADTFTYKVNDGSEDSAIATVSLTVNPVNDDPVVQGQSVAVEEDTAKPIVLTGNDVDGDSLSYTVVSQPSHGVLTGTAPNITYSPEENYHGSDNFSFKINDGTVDSAVTTVQLTVSSVNDAPVAQVSALSTNEDSALPVVLAGRDVDGDALTYVVVANPAHGTLSGTPPNLVYTPVQNYHGADSLTYKANDGTVDSTVVTVAITVTSVNDDPVAQNINLTTTEGAPVTVLLSGTDVDGSVLYYELLSNPAQGVLSGAAPNFTYTPNPDVTGNDSFRYRVTDGHSYSAVATVSIFVTPKSGQDAIAVNAGEDQIISISSPANVQVTNLLPSMMIQTNEGDDFWVAFASSQQNAKAIEVLLSAKEATDVRVEIPGLSFDQSFTVGANQVVAVSLPLTLQPTAFTINTDQIVENKGVHVTSNKPISVYGTNSRGSSSADGFMALPSHVLGKDYILQSYGASWRGSGLAVVATADNTRIVIHPSISVKFRFGDNTYNPTTPYTVVLNQGDVHYLYPDSGATSSPSYLDLSGSRVSSDKPVAVFGTSLGTQIPNDLHASDQLVEQLIPIDLWQKDYYTVPLALRFGDTFKIQAAEDNTMVSINGVTMATVNQGESYETVLTEASHISADKPIHVMQYSHGWGDGVIASQTGDPFMMAVVPPAQFKKEYVLLNDLNDGETLPIRIKEYTHHVNIAVPESGIYGMMLDGVPIDPASFSQIQSSGYFQTQLHLVEGVHKITGTVAFGAQIYGFAKATSYGYAGGYDFSPSVDSVVLTPESSSLQQFGQSSLSALVADSDGNPMPGVEVKFEVSGASNATAYAVSGVDGKAHYSYSSSQAGADQVVASAQSVWDVATITWTPMEVRLVGAFTKDADAPCLPTFAWSVVSGPGSVSFGDSASIDTIAHFSKTGNYILRLTALCGDQTESDDVVISVISSNDLTVDAGSDQTVTMPLDANLSGSASAGNLSLGGDFITSWSLVSGPEGANPNVANVGALNTTVQFDQEGAYTFKLEAEYLGVVQNDIVTVNVLSNGGAPPDGSGNTAPVVSAGENMAIYLVNNSSATLQGSVNDDGLPNGLALSHQWSLKTGNVSASISNTSSLSSAVTFTDPGIYTFVLTASDGQFTVQDEVTVQVFSSDNEIPVVDAGGDQTIDLGVTTTASLVGTATDDGNPLGGFLSKQWRLVTGYAGYVIEDPSSAVTSVRFSAPGEYIFALSGSDGSTTVEDQVRIIVKEAPRTAWVYPFGDAVFDGGNSLNLSVVADDRDGSIESVEIFDGVASLGMATLTNAATKQYSLSISGGLAMGVHQLTAKATDNDGLVTTSNAIAVEFLDPSLVPTSNFALEITSPSESDAIKGKVDVLGTAAGVFMDHYVLQYRETIRGQTNPWYDFSSGDTLVINDVLGELDPSLLRNGHYQLRILAFSDGGQQATSNIVDIIIDGNLKIGHFTLAFEDMSIPVSGIPLSVTRAYDSRDGDEGDFGVGWTVGLKSLRVRNGRVLGQNWEQVKSRVGLIPQFCINPLSRKRVSIIFPGGRTEVFEVSSNCQKLTNVIGGQLTFIPINGSQGNLEVDDPGFIWQGAIEGPGTLVGVDFQPYNPTRFRYTEPDGTSYVIDENLGLVSLTDTNNNTLTINASGVHHSAGESILFTRDAANGNRITEVTDPAGEKILYGYDANGRLSTVTNRAGEVTTFFYENANFPSYLTRINDARGVQAIRSEYDESGRLVKQIDANGNAIEFEHDIANKREIIRDRLGNVTIHEFDDYGNITKTTDALGNVTTRSYDDQDNETSMTTPEGVTTTRSFDSSNNLLTETDGAGNVTSYSYTSTKRPLTITDALGRVTSMAYGTNGNLTSMTDAANTSTGFGYSGSGNLSSLTDANGTVTSYTHDGKGRELTMTVASSTGAILRTEAYEYDTLGNRTKSTTTRTLADGNVESLITDYEYDAENRLTKTTLPDGSISSTEYNSIGKQSKTIDALNRETTYQYDDRGNLTLTTYPDNTTTSTAYDVEGRRTASTDRLGVTTYFVYDALGRLVKTILPDDTMPAAVLSEVADILAAGELADNPASTTEYDGDGRVTASIDTLGNRTEYEYDSASRRVLVRDALGNVTRAAYDDAGQQTSVTDALNRVTSFQYDHAGRLFKTTLPDTTTTQVAYDTLGRRTSVTDQEGNTTQFEYDDLGRLTAVIDAENNRTEYEYNEQGSLLIQRDAEGRETKFAYDSLGRRTQRTLPQGQVETVTYNIIGNMLSRNDFNGHTTSYAYDIMNRLTSMTADASHPSLSLVHAPAKFEYGYDTLGRRNSATVKDTGGNVIYQRGWTFDARGRNTLATSTNGNIGYAYDANSNLTGAKSSTAGGYDQSYDYDALNRMTTAYSGQEGVDSNAYGVASYGYDAVGNMTGSGYANGVGHQYNYSALNRLKELTVGKMSSGVDPPSISTIHQKYTYSLNNAGHRTQIIEHSGRTINHVFDKLYRLKSETITGDTNAQNGTVTYTHDKVGNRLSRTVAGTSGLQAKIPNQNQTYTANDHLTGDTVDSNGNTIASPIAHLADHTGTYTDVYDFRNKLIKRSYTGGKVILVSYDADGNRVSKEVLDGSLGIREHHYLVDTNNHTGYAQVVEEKDGAGVLTRVNLFGHDLVSTSFLSEGYQRYYQYDGLGSVRALSDENGDVTDEYTYDAFGLLLSSSGSTPNQYRYTGEQWDADLGMYFLRARYMNVQTGRFHSMDTYEGSRNSPLSLHKYLYGNANPVMFTDPTGQFSMSDVGAALSSISTLSRIGFTAFRTGRVVATAARGMRLFLAGRAAMFRLALAAPRIIEGVQVGATLVAGGAYVLSSTLIGVANVLDRMALNSYRNGNPIPEYPIWDRGAAGENAAGANLGGNVAKIDSIHNRNGSTIGIQIFTTAAETEDKMIQAIRNKVRTLNGIEGQRITGTTTSGVRVNYPPNTISPGGVGLLVQVKESNAHIATSTRVLREISNLARSTGRIIRIVPLRRF